MTPDIVPGDKVSISFGGVVAGDTTVSTFLAVVVLLRGRGRPRRRPTSAHVNWLTLVAVTAVTVIGFAGSGLAWFDDFAGSGGQSVMAPPH